MTSSFKNVDKETSINYLKMLIELEGTDVMKNINCKPIIINGENTFKDAIKSVDYFTDIWPNLDVIKIKDAATCLSKSQQKDYRNSVKKMNLLSLVIFVF